MYIQFVLCWVLLPLLQAAAAAGSHEVGLALRAPSPAADALVPQRPLLLWLVCDMLVASDIEGGLHGLDRLSGRLVWLIPGLSALVQIALPNTLPSVWAVEPHGDGSLYAFLPADGLRRIPASIAQLVLELPFQLPGDPTVYTGTRHSLLYEIRLSDGHIVGTYGDGEGSLGKPQLMCDRIPDLPTVLMGRTVYELRIHSPNGTTWNVTYAHWGPNTVDADLAMQNTSPVDDTYIAPFYDELVLAIDVHSNAAKWVLKLPAITVQVFDVFHDNHHQHALLPHPLTPPQHTRVLGTFMDKTSEGLWYAMLGDKYPLMVQLAPAAKFRSLRWRTADLAGDSQYLVLHGVHPTVDGFGATEPASPAVQEATAWQLYPQFPALPTAQQAHQLLDPPAETQKPVPQQEDIRGSVWRVLLRLAENAATTVLLGGLVYGLGRLGVQAPFTRQAVPDVAAEPVDKKVTFNDTPKKARKRGSRGGRKSRSDEKSLAVETVFNGSPVLLELIILDEILGYGLHGTVVYKGTFGRRLVAVKRLLVDFFDVAQHEVNLLQDSDDHTNVVRYFCLQERDRFLYIALELCSCSLEDVVEKSEYSATLALLTPQQVLLQMVRGLHHLHALKIVHRDIKPQNILVAPAKHHGEPPRMLILDFGLCKRLEADQLLFRATTANAAGTLGWRAPELLVDENNLVYNNVVTLELITLDLQHSIPGMTLQQLEPLVYDSPLQRKLTRAIDIFLLGCVFYYVLSGGHHPFGDRYLREGNIIKGDYGLELLTGEDAEEATHLVAHMISRSPKQRLTTGQVMMHPYFWSSAKRLDFLLRVLDRFEVESRDPPSALLLRLEEAAPAVVGRDWQAQFDRGFMGNLEKYRKYRGDRLLDLLRALRNKYHHFNDLQGSLAKAMLPLPEGFYSYFARRFPNLLMEVYFVVSEELREDAGLRCFFE